MALNGTTTVGDGDVNAAEDETISGNWEYETQIQTSATSQPFIERKASDGWASLDIEGDANPSYRWETNPGTRAFGIKDLSTNLFLIDVRPSGNVELPNGDLHFPANGLGVSFFSNTGDPFKIFRDSNTGDLNFESSNGNNFMYAPTGSQPEFPYGFTTHEAIDFPSGARLQENANGELEAVDSAGNVTVIS